LDAVVALALRVSNFAITSLTSDSHVRASSQVLFQRTASSKKWWLINDSGVQFTKSMALKRARNSSVRALLNQMLNEIQVSKDTLLLALVLFALNTFELKFVEFVPQVSV
jgi:hypothetical protein